MFELVDPTSIDAASLRRALALVAVAIERGGADEKLVDVADAIARGDMQLWTTEKSAAVTAVVSVRRPVGDPRMACQILYVGGDMTELLEFEEQITERAAAIGCARLEGAGRTGWGRALRDRGWRPTGSVFKELRHV
jgi:hypothetical protein